jgi:hypothetical protein
MNQGLSAHKYRLKQQEKERKAKEAKDKNIKNFEREEEEIKAKEAKEEAKQEEAKKQKEKNKIENCKNAENIEAFKFAECGNVYTNNTDGTPNVFLNFFEHTTAGQKLAENWPTICPKQQTSDEFYKNGCDNWVKDGKKYTWKDTEVGKKKADGKMAKCLDAENKEKFYQDLHCDNIRLEDGQSKIGNIYLGWGDTKKGEEELKASQGNAPTGGKRRTRKGKKSKKRSAKKSRKNHRKSARKSRR